MRTASGPGQGMLPLSGLEEELAALGEEVARLKAENARLLRLLELSPREARPPGPVQTGIFDASPGPVTAARPPRRRSPSSRPCSAPAGRVRAAVGERAHGAVRLDAGCARRLAQGRPAAERQYLPLTEEVITAHLSGELELGLYPLLDGDRCGWLAADFDGPAAMLDALAYLKAARAAGAPAALEVSRSGQGAHVWLFFTAPVRGHARQRRQRAAPRGDRRARADGPGQLRPAVPLAGRVPSAGWAT